MNTTFTQSKAIFSVYKPTLLIKQWMSNIMATELEKLNKRIDKLERQKSQEIITLVEILSNATFFGSIKKTSCEYAKNGQCSYYMLRSEVKNKIPITTNCRISDCQITTAHHHIELSDITCTFCQKLHKSQ